MWDKKLSIGSKLFVVSVSLKVGYVMESTLNKPSQPNGITTHPTRFIMSLGGIGLFIVYY
jgi:hypothetical protein